MRTLRVIVQEFALEFALAMFPMQMVHVIRIHWLLPTSFPFTTSLPICQKILPIFWNETPENLNASLFDFQLYVGN